MASSGLNAFPGMANEVDLGEGLDDLDFGGAAAAQLNMGVPSYDEGEEDVPWPAGVTPQGDELAVSREEAQELSGFGPPPKGFFNAPMYALRVFSALRHLRDKDEQAQKRLGELELSRDEKLADLAEKKRPELQGKERFSSLYAEVDKHQQNIGQKKRALESADVEGAQALRDVQAELDTFNAERVGRQRERDARASVVTEAELTLKRHYAALKKIEIEWRNIEKKAQKLPGQEMPDDLDAALDVLDEQREKERASFDEAKRQRKQSLTLLEDANNELRLTVAEVQRCEAQKEGLLMAYEGDIAVHSRALDKARSDLRHELADAGRVIVDLRGEIPVEVPTRQDLLAADEVVAAAAIHRETTRLALASMDQETYDLGKAIWIGSVAAVVVLLLVAAF
jgi:hypothetical protein